MSKNSFRCAAQCLNQLRHHIPLTELVMNLIFSSIHWLLSIVKTIQSTVTTTSESFSRIALHTYYEKSKEMHTPCYLVTGPRTRYPWLCQPRSTPLHESFVLSSSPLITPLLYGWTGVRVCFISVPNLQNAADKERRVYTATKQSAAMKSNAPPKVKSWQCLGTS